MNFLINGAGRPGPRARRRIEAALIQQFEFSCVSIVDATVSGARRIIQQKRPVAVARCHRRLVQNHHESAARGGAARERLHHRGWCLRSRCCSGSSSSRHAVSCMSTCARRARWRSPPRACGKAEPAGGEIELFEQCGGFGLGRRIAVARGAAARVAAEQHIIERPSPEIRGLVLQEDSQVLCSSAVARRRSRGSAVPPCLPRAAQTRQREQKARLPKPLRPSTAQHSPRPIRRASPSMSVLPATAMERSRTASISATSPAARAAPARRPALLRPRREAPPQREWSAPTHRRAKAAACGDRHGQQRAVIMHAHQPQQVRDDQPDETYGTADQDRGHGGERRAAEGHRLHAGHGDAKRARLVFSSASRSSDRPGTAPRSPR